jgi:predicted  nucleic acid-binding Zn-ribbon protein
MTGNIKELEKKIASIEGERDELQRLINSLDEKLLLAKARFRQEGRRADPMWFAETTAQTKKLRFDVQVLNRRAGTLRSELREIRGGLERLFMEIAMDRLPPDIFYDLMESASERYVGAGRMDGEVT